MGLLEKQSAVSPSVVRELLDYDRESGTLTWRARSLKWFKDERSWKIWNTRYSGRPAFTAVGNSGYLCGSLFNSLYPAHRVAWAHMHGEWPAGDVDHRNRDKTDNRAINLREASRSQNLTNRGGVRGYQKHGRRWRAYISRAKRCVCVGSYGCETAAMLARRAAERQEYGEFSQRYEGNSDR